MKRRVARNVTDTRGVIGRYSAKKVGSARLPGQSRQAVVSSAAGWSID